ncbi:hypothetical protein ACET63_15595 [Aeromonas sanarellii]|nr:hypothetical protein KXJ75_04925 [Aeromonas sanarellii]
MATTAALAKANATAAESLLFLSMASILPDCFLFASITALVGAVRKAYQGLMTDVKWSGEDGDEAGNQMTIYD